MLYNSKLILSDDYVLGLLDSAVKSMKDKDWRTAMRRSMVFGTEKMTLFARCGN